DDGIDLYNNSRQFRFDNVSFPLQDVDLLQLNRSRDNVVVFLRGFELEYEATEHFVLHAQAGIDIPNPGNQPMLKAFQTCSLGLRDQSSNSPFGGLIHYLAAAFPKQPAYPFATVKFHFTNGVGAPDFVVNHVNVPVTPLKPEQVFFGITAIDHRFDNS